MNNLPQPNPEQQAVSQALLALIHTHINEAGGWLSFADYMRLALYAPGLGYYSGGSRKFGAQGDFVTAPELSPLFGRCIACPIAQTLQALGGGDVLEVGAGSGALAVDVLQALESQGSLPDHYFILELSGELAARQQARIAAALPHLIDRVSWLTELPQQFAGAIIGNEVLDAMPCRLVRRNEGQWQERGVAWQEGLCWADRPLHEPALIAHLPELPDGYCTEVQPEACAFVRSLFEACARAVLILPDYGFVGSEYYHPQRTSGTMMCHYRHHSHDQPFHLPGLEDITTHVDFSKIWQAGDETGWALQGFTSQASFLLDAGILQDLAQLDATSPAYRQASSALQTMLSPAEMGELFKVIAFSKGVDLPELLCGFRRDDRSGSL